MDSLTINATSEGNVKIRLIGHCIICLKKVSTGPEEGTTEKCEEQGYPEAAPKSLVSTPGFLATFQEVWGILQNGSEVEGSNGSGEANGKGCTSSSFGITLEKVVSAGSQINVTFSRTPTPTICHQCFRKILAVENMMKVVRHQIRDIKRLVKESRKGGKFAGRAEQIQKTLQVFTLEVDDRGTDGHLDFEDDKNDDHDHNSENEVEEKEKPKLRRGRGRPPKPKPPISETSMDSVDGEDNSMDYHQDDNTNNSEDNKEDPDFQIKVEPQDSDEDDGGGGDDGSNYSDEFLAAGSSAKSLRSSGGRSSSVPSKKDNPPPPKGGSFVYGSSSQRIRWQTIELSDEDIAKDWRIRCKTLQKNGSISAYYCAHGKYCRARIKKKILKNGASVLTTNGLEHSNHRDRNFGLTMEQKEFVHRCLELGVNRPNNILVSFKAKGVPVPRKKQVCCYLDRIRRTERNKTSKNSEVVGGNPVEGQKEGKEDEEKS